MVAVVVGLAFILASSSLRYGRSGPAIQQARSASGPAGEASSPAAITSSPVGPSKTQSPSDGAQNDTKPSPTKVANRPCVPVVISVPSHGVKSATVEDHPLNHDGSLYFPINPRITNWSNFPWTGPGADHGTAIIGSHINYGGVDGVFHDLGTYQVGERVVVTCQDGRRIVYAVVPASLMGFMVDPKHPAVVNESKTILAHDLGKKGRPLHQLLFDQDASFGRPGEPESGRLELASCGGPFDRSSGNYLDNYYVYALPLQGQTTTQ